MQYGTTDPDAYCQEIKQVFQGGGAPVVSAHPPQRPADVRAAGGVCAASRCYC